jgi:hypothetical protein
MLCINEISGILDHTEACESIVEMARAPRIGLHPEIRAYALTLIELQVPITQLQQRCREFAKERFNNAPGDIHHRFVLNDHETTSLYRTQFAGFGIPQRSAAEENLDKWFRTNNPSPPDPAMTDACLYYKACGDDPSDRFIIIISTPEQRSMAWRHGHKKLLLLDGTFGINSARSLLFIGMAINNENKGIPIVFFHFTARKTSAATHGDYDGPLLQDLLSRWKQAMGRNDAGEDFEIKVVFTDNDTRERNALSAVFPGALLLLCRFHTAQAWRNGVNRKIRVIPKGPARNEVRRTIAKFLAVLLKDITKFEDAIAHYNKHLDYFTKLGEQTDTISKKKSQGGLAFLSYFQSYLRLREFWVAWSPAGVLEASRILHVEPDQVPRTTNHLESFNSRIKHRYFGAYQHSGRLPRIDVWIVILITKVIPAFFQELEVKEAKAEYFRAMQLAPSHNHNLSIMIDTSTSTSCDPDKSLIPSDAEFNAVEQFDAWAEMEFIDVICESEGEAEENGNEEDSM